MHHLDPVGRLAPSSLDVSRAAAARHAHTVALRAASDRTRADRAPRPRSWFHVVVGKLASL